jgi:hypothetical protein
MVLIDEFFFLAKIYKYIYDYVKLFINLIWVCVMFDLGRKNLRCFSNLLEGVSQGTVNGLLSIGDQTVGRIYNKIKNDTWSATTIGEQCADSIDWIEPEGSLEKGFNMAGKVAGEVGSFIGLTVATAGVGGYVAGATGVARGASVLGKAGRLSKAMNSVSNGVSSATKSLSKIANNVMSQPFSSHMSTAKNLNRAYKTAKWINGESGSQVSPAKNGGSHYSEGPHIQVASISPVHNKASSNDKSGTDKMNAGFRRRRLLESRAMRMA